MRNHINPRDDYESKSFLLYVAIICFAIYLIHLVTGSAPEAKPEYMDFTVYVDFNGQENFTALDPLIVASDENFVHKLEQTSVSMRPNENYYAYTFKVDAVPDTVYVMKPCIYKKIEEGPVCVQLNGSAGKAELDGQDWFTVTDVTCSKIAAGVFHIAVSLEASLSAYPAEMYLTVGDVRLSSIPGDPDSDVNFDHEDNFKSAVYCFKYNVGAADDISGLLDQAVLEAGDIYMKICNVDVSVSSNMDTVKLVVKQE